VAESGNALVLSAAQELICDAKRKPVPFAGFRVQIPTLAHRRGPAPFPIKFIKGAKGKGILTNMPTYFNKGAEQVKVSLLVAYMQRGMFMCLDRRLFWIKAVYNRYVA